MIDPSQSSCDDADLVIQTASESDPWASLAGPAALGRSLLSSPGAVAPAPWADAPRITLDEASLASPATLDIVRRAYLTRTRVVFEVDSTLRAPARGVEGREVWDVAPNFDFVAEATWRLAWANAVDGRDCDHPTWPLRAKAIAGGARFADFLDADVILPDDTSAWCDGGPLHLWGSDVPDFAGAAVVPRVAITNGRLTPVIAHPPTASLAPDQLRAVADPSARARIIAPAGSGKTRVLTERARHVLDSGVPVDSLLLVAFNKRAQEEMRERTTDHPGLRIQTLNALALSILNGTNGFEHRGARVETIDEWKVRDIIAQYVKFARKANTDPVAAWIDALTEVRLGLWSPQHVERAYGGDLDGFAEFFPRFRQHLADHHQVDFDEQIYLAIEVLLRNPEVRLAAERRADVLLVDEFQDLTPAHMLLLRLIAGPSLSIFAVGDDDQTIYGFSGATPEWLVHFEHHVPEAAHHALEVNYRCPAPVITAVANLVSHNVVRVPKQIRPGPNSVGDSTSFTVARVDDQVQRVVSHVRAILEGGVAPSDIAVLSRVNANLVPVRAALVDVGLPVSVRDRGDFLRNSGVESALAWLRLAARSSELAGADIELAARRPGRGLGPKVRGWLGEQTSVEGLVRLAGRMDGPTSTKITDFVRDLERAATFARRATTSTLIEFIHSEIGLDRALATLDASHQGRNGTSNSDGLRSLIALGRQHPDPRSFDSWLRTLLNAPSVENGVTLATVHKVKGLQWPHVVVYDASSTIFPHRLSIDAEEERRVFHVAITRCITSLLITADVASPSPFLRELRAPAAIPRQESREGAMPVSNRSLGGSRPVGASVGLTFRWGGYDFAVQSVASDAVVVSTGESRYTSLPFGWTVVIDGEARMLVAPASRSARQTAKAVPDANPAIYSALKTWRLEQAKADNVPAYVVFNDRTLDELARVCPRTDVELLAISGIGPAKVDRYGDQILTVIQEFLTQMAVFDEPA